MDSSTWNLFLSIKAFSSSLHFCEDSNSYLQKFQMTVLFPVFFHFQSDFIYLSFPQTPLNEVSAKLFKKSLLSTYSVSGVVLSASKQKRWCARPRPPQGLAQNSLLCLKKKTWGSDVNCAVSIGTRGFYISVSLHEKCRLVACKPQRSWEEREEREEGHSHPRLGDPD